MFSEVLKSLYVEMNENEWKTFNGLCESVHKIDSSSDVIEKLRQYSKISRTVFNLLDHCDCDLFDEYLELSILLTSKFEKFRADQELEKQGYCGVLTLFDGESYRCKITSRIRPIPISQTCLYFPKSFIENTGNGRSI